MKVLCVNLVAGMVLFGGCGRPPCLADGKQLLTASSTGTGCMSKEAVLHVRSGELATVEFSGEEFVCSLAREPQADCRDSRYYSCLPSGGGESLQLELGVNSREISGEIIQDAGVCSTWALGGICSQPCPP